MNDSGQHESETLDPASLGPAGHDPIVFELFKNAIFSIADEMALTVFRTTYSGVLKDNMDYSTGFADADGTLVAQGLTLPAHLGSVPTAMRSIMRRFRDDIHPGDVFIMNDPFDGGMHLPDIFVVKPLYHAGERIAFACTVCHHGDVGGRVAGSNASDSTEIYAEGLRIPPLKFYERGQPNRTLMAIIEKNVRLPVQLFGDLRAQLAACHIAETQFAELVARYGLEQTRFYMNELVEYAERLTRAALEKLPDGEWSFEDWIDDDGVDYGKPIRLFVTITKTAGHMRVDWTGTAPQVRGAINNTLSFTQAASFTAVRSVLPLGIPNNEGVFRAIEVICPPGTIGNGVLPAVVEGSLRLIEEGARETGRRLEDLDVWWSLRPALTESHAEAMEIAKATVSSAGNHSMRFGIEGKHVPPELVEPIKEYTKAYTSRQHLFLGGPNVQAMERAGLTEYFLDRFAVAGDPAAWVERLKELEERGVNKIWFAGMGGRKELRLLGEEIMPAL